MSSSPASVHTKMSIKKLTILCDLDDTLLKNDFNIFLPAYLKAFSKEVTLLPENVFVPNLLSGTNKMISNQDPTCTLQEIFDRSFFSAIELDKSILEPIIKKFYGEVFQTLQPLTAPYVESKNLIEYALKNHHHTVIATNPLFPFTATAQRLDWARISPHDYPYSLVTTYEIFHFSKPNVSYYAEILGKLGWPESLAVMIGNDLEEDIQPASKLGLPTYWITTSMNIPNFERHPLSEQGNLEGVIPWLEKLSRQSNSFLSFSLENLPHILRSTPAVFDSLLKRNHTEQHRSNPIKISRFLNELIQHESAHLITVETLLKKPNAGLSIKESLPAYHQEADYLQVYFSQRKTLLDLIQQIPQTIHASSNKQVFLTALETIARTDQTMIRELKTILAD